MAKPNDTPNDAPNAQAPTTPPASSTRYSPQFATLLQSLLDSHASAPPVPKPPKHCRPKRIRPQRRVTVTSSLPPNSEQEIPWVRLCGRWLAIAGFNIHTRVRVHVAKGVMVLIPEPTQTNEEPGSPPEAI